MSTPNNEVFTRFLKLIEDEELCLLLTDEELTYHLEYFLDESLSTYFKKCKKDLSDVESADFYTKTVTATAGQTEFIADRYPTNPNESAIELFITVEGVAVGFTFDENTKKFTLSVPTTLGDEVTYGYNFVGQFNQDLDSEEMWILAHGMVITWNSGKVYAEKKLKNALSNSDYSVYSPANLLDKLIAVREQSLKEIRKLVVSYSFNGFTGFN